MPVFISAKATRGILLKNAPQTPTPSSMKFRPCIDIHGGKVQWRVHRWSRTILILPSMDLTLPSPLP